MNRFKNCKSLVDLYNVFASEDVAEFTNLSSEELERIAVVFEANMPINTAMPKTPLDANGYIYIWNVTLEEVETMPIPEEVETVDEEDKETMEESDMGTNETTNNTTINNEFKKIMEDANMKDKKTTVATKVATARVRIVSTLKGIKGEAIKDRQGLMDTCDKSLDEIKNTMGPVLEVLDDALGCSALKEEICAIMYDTLNDTKSESGFFKMASKCREAIDRKIKVTLKADPDDKLGKVAALRTLAGEDENGNKIVYVQSIFEAFANAVVWICRKVTRKLRSWFGVEEESNIFGSAGVAIAQVFAKIGNVIKNVAKIIGTVLSYAVSYTVAGIIKVTSLVITAIKFVVSKIKSWYEAAKSKITKEDLEDFEFVEDDENPGVVVLEEDDIE